jgi:hypothetical protein
VAQPREIVQRIPIIIGMPLQLIIIGMPIAIIAFMALQRSAMPSMPPPSMGIIRHVIPSFVISKVIRHIIGIAMGIIPIGIMPGIIPFIMGMPPIIPGIIPLIMPGMPPIIPGMPVMPGIIPPIGIGIIIGIIAGMPPA